MHTKIYNRHTHTQFEAMHLVKENQIIAKQWQNQTKLWLNDVFGILGEAGDALEKDHVSFAPAKGANDISFKQAGPRLDPKPPLVRD